MDKRVENFIQQHPAWRAQLSKGELYLAIPSIIMDALGESKGKGAWWQNNDKRWEEELHFAHMVEELSGGVGVRGGRIVQFPPLMRPPSYSAQITEDVITTMGWDSEINFEEAKKALVEAEEGKLPAIRMRILGYAGWLVTSAMYRNELDELKSKWHSSFPSFPIRFSSSPGDSSQDALLQYTQAFLTRWGLTELSGWDFPCPQGPLFGAHDVLRYIQNVQLPGIALYVPAWYAVLDDKDDILAELKNRQRKWFENRLHKEEDWPITNYSRFAGIFLCCYALKALGARGAVAKNKPGYDAIMQAISIWLNQRLPENRGQGNYGKGEGGKEDIDKGSRAKRLIELMNSRISSKRINISQAKAKK